MMYFNSEEYGGKLNIIYLVSSSSTTREKRPLFVFKSGATYEGEWIGNKRDG